MSVTILINSTHDPFFLITDFESVFILISCSSSLQAVPKSVLKSKFPAQIFHRDYCQGKNRNKTTKVKMFTFYSHL